MDNSKKLTVITPDKLAAAKAAAEFDKQQIAAAAYAEGVKSGERHKAMAFVFGGILIGALIMGAFTMMASERAMYALGGITDRILGRVVEPVELQPAGNVDLAAEYTRNSELARQQSCREGVIDPRTGRCPARPGPIVPRDR
jgi:hypothetical protein